MTRRGFLGGLAGTLLAGLLVSAYGVLVEPLLRMRVQRWRLRPPGWTAGPLTIAIVADVHVCEPWMTLDRLRQVVARTNALGADLILFLGDLEAGHRFVTGKVPLDRAAEALAGLRAPLGVHAVQGNHDWWHDEAAQATGHGPTEVFRVLTAAGIPVMENAAVRIGSGAQAFWLAGLSDQLAIGIGPGRFRGLDNLPATLAQVTDDSPVILLAHEPDIFPRVPDRVCLTLSGHTHGGQVRLFGWSPVVPSEFGNRFAYGVVQEAGRMLVVSGGLGCSIIPFRLGVVPEITVVELS